VFFPGENEELLAGDDATTGRNVGSLSMFVGGDAVELRYGASRNFGVFTAFNIAEHCEVGDLWKG
jgi:hypothetical protein